MMQPDDLLSQLLTQQENEVVEFKSGKSSFGFEKLGKYFSALANEANLLDMPNAWLVLGIRDEDHALVGTNWKEAPKSRELLKHSIAESTNDRLTFRTIHELWREGKRILLFEIPAAPQGIPVRFKGQPYGREGESLGPLNVEEYDKIRGQAIRKDWSSEICVGATFEDLESEAIHTARDLYKIKNPKLVEKVDVWDDITFLNKAKITIKGEITNAAVVLLGKSESEHMLTPAVARITWVLKKDDGSSQDYQHFSCPFLLTADEVFKKIRNFKYRYQRSDSLFPEEVNAFDPSVIREALNNCIAHQDYEMGEKITVVEQADGVLHFSNAGSFLPDSVRSVIENNSPMKFYRNRLLVEAMVNLNMIDTIGSGIRTMFESQKEKCFPMPDFELQNNSVDLTIVGKVLDIDYAMKLAQDPGLDLVSIMLLDAVSKHRKISQTDIDCLREKGLIEGRGPNNLFISSTIAEHTDEKVEYMRNRGMDTEAYRKHILDMLGSFKEVDRQDIDKLLFDKLPKVLTVKQKRAKVKNILQQMRKEGLIVLRVETRSWALAEPQQEGLDD